MPAGWPGGSLRRIVSAFEHLAGALRLLRDRRGMTQQRLAEAIESPVKQISAYETGRQRPRIETLERILAALGADAMDLARAMTAFAAGGVGEAGGRVRRAPGGSAATDAGLDAELQGLGSRLPEIDALAGEVLVELLTEAVERQAARLGEDLRASRRAIEVRLRETGTES